jgi:hypothetical protein
MTNDDYLQLDAKKKKKECGRESYVTLDDSFLRSQASGVVAYPWTL